MNAFFEFDSPISDLSFLSTEIEPQGHDSKSVRLDVALRLANGTLIDLEMQSSLKNGHLRRSVLYAALLLVTHTKKGASHTKRKAVGKSIAREVSESDAQPNVISLTLLNDRLPHRDPKKFRHTYQLRDGDDYLDKDCFRIDVIELPKLQEALDKVSPNQRLWMRLFLAQSYAEVTQLAQEEPIFLKVCEVLEMVSKNSKMQDRARMIWEGEFAVRNEKYLLEKERLEEKIRYEKERLEEKMRIEKEAEQKVAAAQHEADKRVAEAQNEAEQKALEAQQAISIAVRALASTGQTSEAIATLLNLSPERVVEILNAR